MLLKGGYFGIRLQGDSSKSGLACIYSLRSL
ncbi:hypothetical protein TMEN_4957 [Trichophyton mentagrophytes]|nr:hypothetical protein TMEN_4957 [Trichophyton mentagrophytes]